MDRVMHCLELAFAAEYSLISFSGNDLALAAEIGPDVIFRGWDQRDDSGTIPVIRIGHLEGISTTFLAQQRSPK